MKLQELKEQIPVERFEVVLRQNAPHKLTFSPSQNRFTIKVVIGMADRHVERLFDYALTFYKNNADSEITVRHHVDPWYLDQ